MRKMDFINCMHHPGINLTVRRGYKWADLKVGEGIRILDNGKPSRIYEFPAIVTELRVKRFYDITQDEMHFEHDPECIDIDGLTKAMRKAYRDFSPGDVCTLVFYEIA